MSGANGIDFGEHKWTAMSDEMAVRIGSSRLPLSSKVMLAIQTGMNNWGHAYFGPHGTELGRIVYGREPTRGMMNTLKEKIKDYRGDGFIAPGDGIECLVLDSEFYQRGSGRGNVVTDPCFEPAHRECRFQRWSSVDGWHIASNQPKDSYSRPRKGDMASPTGDMQSGAACRQTPARNRSDQGERPLEGLDGPEGPEGKERIEGREDAASRRQPQHVGPSVSTCPACTAGRMTKHVIKEHFTVLLPPPQAVGSNGAHVGTAPF